jgi:pyruvate,water dikinase
LGTWPARGEPQEDEGIEPVVDKWMVETALSEEYPFYTRANVGEVFPDPVLPLSFSFAFQNEEGLGSAELGFRNAYERIGVMEASEFPPDECLFLGVVGGYAYLNAAALRMLGHRAPGMTYKDIDDAFFGDAPGVPEFVARPGDDRPDLSERIGATFGWVLTTDGLPDVAAFEDTVNRLRAERPDLPSMSDRELIDYSWELLDTHFEDLFTEHIFISFLATVPIGIITKVCEAVGQPTAILRLLAGLGDVESAAPAMTMWGLGRRVAASPHLTALFDGGVAGLDARLRADGDQAAEDFCRQFDLFLFAYGSRGPNEWEVRSPTWETDPDLALAAIDRMRLAGEGAAPNRANTARAAEREALGAELVAALAGEPETRGQFQAALRAATIFMPGRERTKTNCVKLIQECRMANREFGRRQVEAGLLSSDTSISFLTRDEQYRYLDDPTGWGDIAQARQSHYEEVAALREPFLFVGHPGELSDYPRRDAVSADPVGAGGVLQGVPGCPGKATGRARVVVDSHDPSALEPGDVLVAPLTDPSWTPLFVPAAAVVVDVGAPLSHAIIVSRELGIPCVVSATDATRRIPDGALVEVDGDTGAVTVLEAP